MEVYMFRAAYWCPDCIRNWLKNKAEILIRWPDWYAGEGDRVLTEDMLREYLRAKGHNPADEATWDSDKAPKGPYSAGGGEADTPQHCDCCGTFLENPLTSDGLEYVIEQLTDGTGTPEVEDIWRKFYGEDYCDDGRTVNEHLACEDEDTQ